MGFFSDLWNGPSVLANLEIAEAELEATGLIGKVALGSIEACAGIYGRTLQSSVVSGSPQSVVKMMTPDVLEAIGRDFLLHGESLWYIDRSNRKEFKLARVNKYNIEGGLFEEDWQYLCYVPSPTSPKGNLEADSSEVLHFRIGSDRDSTWYGRSPLSSGSSK